MGGVRAEYRYDGLVLVCDPATVARVHALLRAELGVAAAPDGAAVRHIAVRPDVPPPVARIGWLSAVGLAVGSAVSGVVFIAGWVQVAGWVSR